MQQPCNGFLLERSYIPFYSSAKNNRLFNNLTVVLLCTAKGRPRRSRRAPAGRGYVNAKTSLYRALSEPRLLGSATTTSKGNQPLSSLCSSRPLRPFTGDHTPSSLKFGPPPVRGSLSFGAVGVVGCVEFLNLEIWTTAGRLLCLSVLLLLSAHTPPVVYSNVSSRYM